MTRLETITEDFATAPVPAAKTVSGLRVALIIIGVSIALPAFLMGVQLGTALGLVRTGFALVSGGMILAAVASMTALVGAETHLSTYMVVQFSFGAGGARVVNGVFAATILGWFGVNAALFGDAMVATTAQLFHVAGGWPSYVLGGSMLMTLTTLFGFQALNRLALMTVPLLVIVLVAVTTTALLHAPPGKLLGTHVPTISMGLAISAVVGGNMVGAAVVPDLSRYICSRRAAVASMFASYGVAGPLILMSAAIPSLVTGKADLMTILLGVGLGLPALFVLVISSWITNSANLYSSGLSLAATFRSVKPWKLTLAAGVLGTAVALSGIIRVFMSFLIFLGVLMPPVAAVYVVDFFAVARRRYDVASLANGPLVRWRAFVAWIVGSGVGAATAAGVTTLSTIPACDAFLVAGLMYFALMRWKFMLLRSGAMAIARAVERRGG